MPVLTWNSSWHPKTDSSYTKKPSVRTIKFGDNYAHRSPNGINTKAKVWSLEYEDSPSVIAAMEAFLDQQGGVKAFEWTDPENKTGKYICSEWTVKRPEPSAYHVLNVRFEQVFDANNI